MVWITDQASEAEIYGSRDTFMFNRRGFPLLEAHSAPVLANEAPDAL